MISKPSIDHCLQCSEEIDYRVYCFSTNRLGLGLCHSCLKYLFEKRDRLSSEAKDLFSILRANSVPAFLEYYDGFKTVDIAIPSIHLYLEINGTQHYENPQQAYIDLLRMFYSYKQGYTTIALPNFLFPLYTIETAQIIINLYRESVQANAN
jgi:hypothetical protein